MLFSKFSEYLQLLETTSSRLEITAQLAKLLQELDSSEIRETCYLLQGQLLPPYTGREFQISVKTVLKAITRLLPMTSINEVSLFGDMTSGGEEKKVEERYKNVGDLGKVAESFLQEIEQKHSSASISDVYEKLFEIAQESGAQSQQRKLDGLVNLLKILDPQSAKFVIRIILGRLRLGFSDMTIIDAMSWAMTGGKSERDILELAYQKRTDIGQLAELYLVEKNESLRQLQLKNYSVQVGVPVIPALCQRLNSASEMIEKMTEVIVEPKYDGLRVQIHYQKKSNGEEFLLKTFTRNLEETSDMFPELHNAVKTLKCESCILDAEAIGYDPVSGDLLPFQQTIQRKRKHDVAEKAVELPLRFYVFDILSLDGQDLLDIPLIERKKSLQMLFQDNEWLYHSPEILTRDPKILHEKHEEYLATGLEGVVVKQSGSAYQSGRKGWSWVKMKESEGKTGKLADTIDVVVMGYYRGKGKRAEFGIGAVLVGVYDDAANQIMTIAKIGTGLTDEVLKETKIKCDELQTKEKPSIYQVEKYLVPDVWCLPGFVVEVAADELTISSLHTAKLALRFPRLVKYRLEKNWQQSTSFAELKQLAQLALS